VAEELEPLGPLARGALDAERRREGVDPAMGDRLLARVMTSVAVGAAVAGAAGIANAAGTTGAGAAAGTGAGAAGASATAGAGTSAAGASAGVVAGLTTKTLALVAAAFALGTGTGAAIHAAASRPAPVPATATASPSARPSSDRDRDRDRDRAPPPTEPVAVSSAPSASEGALPSVPVGALPGVRPPPAGANDAGPRAGASASDVDLAAERALVDRARTALTRGQPASALEALDAHARSYPRGRLGEEREALAVDALARSGQMDAARARAARFHASYPDSVFAGVVNAAIAPR